MLYEPRQNPNRDSRCLSCVSVVVVAIHAAGCSPTDEGPVAASGGAVREAIGRGHGFCSDAIEAAALAALAAAAAAAEARSASAGAAFRSQRFSAARPSSACHRSRCIVAATNGSQPSLRASQASTQGHGPCRLKSHY